MSSNSNERQASNVDLSNFKYLSNKERKEINREVLCLVEHAERKLSKNHSISYPFVDRHCKELQSIIKNIAAENNLEKIVEAESMLVSLSTNFENCRNHSVSHSQNIMDFITQSDALSSTLDHCEYYKSYKDYEIVMKTHTKNVRSCEKYGLPEDAVSHNLNSNIASLKDAKKSNIGPSEYDNLTDIRIKALNRAKILYMQRQIPFMIEFAEKNPNKPLAFSFALNRVGIEKNVQTLLDKSDEVLGIQRDKEQSQNQTQQTQEPASNKKAKSSPDLER